MPLNLAMTVMSVAEFVLWAVLGFLFWRKKLQRRFPAMGAYLALRVGSMPVLLLLLFGQSRHWFNDYCYACYFFAYWSVYIVSAVLLYFICVEVFRSALSAFPGLMRFGIVVFRWAALATVLLTLSSITSSHRGFALLPEIANALMRPMSIVALCLLAFLCLSMNALHLSVRDFSFGIALGFGLFSANDFILSLLFRAHTSLTDPLQFVYESVILATLGAGAIYFALPEPARKPVVIPASSTIYRWNEIASALGHTGTQVAVQQEPANSFFLTDVERVVEKVLTRSLKGSESEL
jgi:hypothetical protein